MFCINTFSYFRAIRKTTFIFPIIHSSYKYIRGLQDHPQIQYFAESTHKTQYLVTTMIITSKAKDA